MNQVEEFIFSFPSPQKDVLLYLHNSLTSKFNLNPKIRFKIPFYYNKSWICYLNPIKPDKIELNFTRGNELSNKQGILLAKNRKQVKGIEFSNIESIDEQSVFEIINEAIILDENVPYKSKRKSKGKL